MSRLGFCGAIWGIPPRRKVGAALDLVTQRRRIENDVIMNMDFVNVRRYDKGMAAFGKPKGKLPPDLVGLLRRDLAGLKALPGMVSDHILVALIPAGLHKILTRNSTLYLL